MRERICIRHSCSPFPHSKPFTVRLPPSTQELLLLLLRILLLVAMRLPSLSKHRSLRPWSYDGCPVQGASANHHYLGDHLTAHHLPEYLTSSDLKMSICEPLFNKPSLVKGKSLNALSRAPPICTGSPSSADQTPSNPFTTWLPVSMLGYTFVSDWLWYHMKR